MIAPAQRENALRRPKKAKKSSPNALEFGENAACVSPNELSKFNSRYIGGSQTFPRKAHLNYSGEVLKTRTFEPYFLGQFVATDIGTKVSD